MGRVVRSIGRAIGGAVRGVARLAGGVVKGISDIGGGILNGLGGLASSALGGSLGGLLSGIPGLNLLGSLGGNLLSTFGSKILGGFAGGDPFNLKGDGGEVPGEILEFVQKNSTLEGTMDSMFKSLGPLASVVGPPINPLTALQGTGLPGAGETQNVRQLLGLA
ncbi:MAG: hypothetical protein HYU64_02910 [Armatimonadetes bacterium]|nr:hypothetical protein [Armatimonadota bacterium]